MENKVAADVVYYVAKTELGMVQLPEDIDQAVDRAILSRNGASGVALLTGHPVAGAGLRGRRLRMYGNKLLEHLRSLTKHPSQGGIFGWNEQQKRRLKQRRKRVISDASVSVLRCFAGDQRIDRCDRTDRFKE